MQNAPAALGFRVHSGWAVLSAVAGSAQAPSLVVRRRIELAARQRRGSVQPYHAAKEMGPELGGAFILSCAESAKAMAQAALREALPELGGYRVIGACVLLASGRELPHLTAILASHAMIHTAEGVFFREALVGGCEACGLPVTRVKERDLMAETAAGAGLTTAQISLRISTMGKLAGPPWRQDEKLATIAAWRLLAQNASG